MTEDQEFFLDLCTDAESGDPEAQLLLGGCYYEGTNGAEQNIDLAIEWLSKSAAQGHAPAMTALAMHYGSEDEGVKDLPKMIQYYLQAAELGDEVAQCNLGNCYYLGYGIEKDLAQAVKWYTESAKQGFPSAYLPLGECYEYGYGVEIDLPRAIELYIKAAEFEKEEAGAALKRLGVDG